jgi:hypothetical protein
MLQRTSGKSEHVVFEPARIMNPEEREERIQRVDPRDKKSKDANEPKTKKKSDKK